MACMLLDLFPASVQRPLLLWRRTLSKYPGTCVDFELSLEDLCGRRPKSPEFLEAC